MKFEIWLKIGINLIIFWNLLLELTVTWEQRKSEKKALRIKSLFKMQNIKNLLKNASSKEGEIKFFFIAIFLLSVPKKDYDKFFSCNITIVGV